MQTTAHVPRSSAEQTREVPTPHQLVEAFRAAGIPVGKSIDYDASNDPNSMLGRPNGYNARTSWADRRVDQAGREDPEGGTIEVFDTPGMAQMRMQYIQGFAQASPMFDEYDFLLDKAGTYLLRISRELTPKQAHQYRGVFGAQFK